MKCNIIGAGRLGRNIGLALSEARIISTLNVCNRTLKSASDACQSIGRGSAVARIEELPTADITWVCSNDDTIGPIVKILADGHFLKPGSFVVHCSGVLNSSLLAELKKKGCFVASFHPLKAFKTNYLSATSFNQVDCVLEGDEEVCNWLNQSFSHLGAYINLIEPQNKTLYHAAACIASNYLITLAAYAAELFEKSGLPQQHSRRMLINLMQSNLINLGQEKKIAASLTGPITRGDIQTIALHLKSMKDQNALNLYKSAGLATLPLTQLPQEKKDKIKQLLSN